MTLNFGTQLIVTSFFLNNFKATVCFFLNVQ